MGDGIIQRASDYLSKNSTQFEVARRAASERASVGEQLVTPDCKRRQRGDYIGGNAATDIQVAINGETSVETISGG